LRREPRPNRAVRNISNLVFLHRDRLVLKSLVVAVIACHVGCPITLRYHDDVDNLPTDKKDLVNSNTLYTPLNP